jgi:ribosomal protein S18 acetylase RimI-like enzyme
LRLAKFRQHSFTQKQGSLGGMMNLLSLMDENLVVHQSYLQALHPAMLVRRDPQLLLVDSGLDCDTLNYVSLARLDAEEAPLRIENTIEHFRHVGRRFSWWLGPQDRPAELPELLEAAGLTNTETETAMAVDLRVLPALQLPEGLKIERVRSMSQLEDFARVLASLWMPPDEQLIAFYRLTAHELLKNDCPLRLYVGYWQREPVSTAELCLAGEGVGLYNVATLEAYRGRGFGSALTLYPLLEGRAAGHRFGVLQAAEDGFHIYQRLGFHALGIYREYQPPR